MSDFNFHMPRYEELPTVGLYLEQTVNYINKCLEPLRISITASMLSNYVKSGYVERPVKKKYYADHIAHLIFIAIVKQTLSMQNIAGLFALQQETYQADIAYNYFCHELERNLKNLFSEKNDNHLTAEMCFEKKTLHCVVTAISYSIYLNFCFDKINKKNN